MWHCNSFVSQVTEKGRSPVRERDGPDLIETGECLLVYTACEKQDEAHAEQTVKQAAAEIARLASQLKVTTVVIHSFAHLFVKLSSPQSALEMMKELQQQLQDEKMTVLRSPFGWFNTLKIDAKGHPLSRVAREIRAG